MKLIFRSKVFVLILSGLLVLFFVILVLVPPLITKDMVNMHVSFSKKYDSNDWGIKSETMFVETEDGLTLACYYVSTEASKGSIIFLSGIHNPSVTAFFGHAKWFQELGYDSYLLEMRAHGESQGDLISLGFKETLDVDAVVSHILNDPSRSEKPIIVYGLSMGGSVAINAIGSNPDIDGVVSLSAYSSFEDNFADNMLMMGAPKVYIALQKPFVKLYTNFKYGWNTSHLSPKTQISQIGDRPALLMHSTEDDQVPFANLERLLEHAPSHVSSWKKQGNHHFILEGEAFREPWTDSEYKEHVEAFLFEHFQ